MPRSITPGTSLAHLRKEAKRWLKALRAHDAHARRRLEAAHPTAPQRPVLRDVQHALAREYGFEGWKALASAVEQPDYGGLAEDLLLAFNARDEAALARFNAHYRRSYTFDDLWSVVWRRLYSFRQRASAEPAQPIEREEARLLIAQDAGFGSWAALTGAASTHIPRVPPFFIDAEQNRIAPRRRLTDAEWDLLIAVMRERRIAALDAAGLMNDAVLTRVTALDHVTALSLGGSRELTDDGLRQLARMPQLEELNLNEYPGGKLTDRGLEVLGALPNLRHFLMTWQRGVSDAGVANLMSCARLEQVDLMGTFTGDGAIAALQGKPMLRRFAGGRLTTDAGLALLHNFPRLHSALGDRAQLLIDGPFTDAGLASLSGLDGLVDLDLFWHVRRITSGAFAHLLALANLEALGADGHLSDDTAMRHIAALPRLRRLRVQESVATEDGFEALSTSATLEALWGRVCPHFASRGFAALSRMPALQTLGIGCANVDDRALALLAEFPALRELTPIGFSDEGFRHVGGCARLQKLSCMYCRETTDAATAHIANLRLRDYYAGLTQITDESLRILGAMPTLERVELYECKGVTDRGLVHLAALPHLRELELTGLPHVTFTGTRVLPGRVRVKYWT